jgi:hypothetical protein
MTIIRPTELGAPLCNGEQPVRRNASMMARGFMTIETDTSTTYTTCPKRGVIVAAALVGLALSAHASAQDVFRYREHALESSLETVIVATRARADDVRLLHERPARIQELQFRAPYQSDSEEADPMQSILFRFVDGQLYQLVVTYNRERTEGLSDADVVNSLRDEYGPPVSGATTVRVDGPGGTFSAMTAVAKWETESSRLLLVRDKYVHDFQLVFTSRSLESRAVAAAREAVRLDVLEAPRRESEQRRKAAADAEAAREKSRRANKEAFRP